MNYTLHQLQVFLKVSQLQSITKAAEQLHLTQPAVSIQLKNFQDQFEVPLSEIVGRRWYITEFGKEVAIAAEKILNEVDAIKEKTMAYQGLLTGRLNISVVSTGKYVMPYFLTNFLKHNIGVELQMDVTNKSRVLESLERNEVDFSLVTVLPDHLQVSSLELMTNKLYVVTNTERKFRNKIYDSEILKELPMIYRESGSGTRFVMEKYFNEHQIPVRKKMELATNEAVKQAVIAGIGCSIMPIIGIKNELNNRELQIISVKGFPIKSTWQLIWLKNKKFSRVAESFLTYLEKEKINIINERFGWIEDFKS